MNKCLRKEKREGRRDGRLNAEFNLYCGLCGYIYGREMWVQDWGSWVFSSQCLPRPGVTWASYSTSVGCNAVILIKQKRAPILRDAGRLWRENECTMSVLLLLLLLSLLDFLLFALIFHQYPLGNLPNSSDSDLRFVHKEKENGWELRRWSPWSCRGHLHQRLWSGQRFSRKT